MKRCVFVAALTSIAFLISAAPVLAHGELQGTDPERGATIRRAPASVRITFTEPPAKGGRFEVLDGCGDSVIDGVGGRASNAELRVDGGEAGRWKVTYRVISAVDGHSTRGSFAFKVQGQTDCDQPQPDPGGPDDEVAQAPPRIDDDDERSGSFPLVPVLIGGGLVLAAVAVRVMGSRSV